MNWKIKSAIIGGVILVLGILLFIIKTQQDSINELKALQSSVIELKKLPDGIVRSQSSYASKDDIENAIKDSGLNLSVIKDDLDSLGADLKGVQRTLAVSKGSSGTELSSTSVDKNKNPNSSVEVQCSDGERVSCPDEFGYRADRQKFDLKDGNQVPIGQIGFSAWKKTPWDYSIYQRDYQLTTVVSVNDDGKHVFHNKFTVNSNGKSYDLPIASSSFIETLPENKFRFTPRLYFGADAGVVLNTTSITPSSRFELVPNLQLGLFSYGKTKTDIDWMFLAIGVGYETQNQLMSFLVSPVNFNIGKPIPLIENLFLGPTLSIDTNANYGLMLGLKVGL